MGSTTEETTGRAGAQSQQGGEAITQLLNMARSGGAQMGDLSGLASGNLTLSPQDRALIQQAQQATGDVARNQMAQNMQQATRQVEDTAIGRSMQGGTIEAMLQAMLGQQGQASLDQLAMQQQGQAAEGMLNMPFQRAQVQLGANQLLLNRLVQGTTPVVNYDAAMRQLNQTSTTESNQGFGQSMAGLGATLGGAWLSGPAGAAFANKLLGTGGNNSSSTT
jgi:hypothetical protein